MKFFRFESIRNRLVFTIAIVAIFAVLLTTAIFAVLEIIQFRESLNTELESTSRIIATHSAAALEFGDPVVADETLRPLARNNRIAAAYILDRDENVFASYVRKDLGEIFSENSIDENNPFRNKYITAKNPVSLSGKELGSIYIVSDFVELRSRFKDKILILMLTFFMISGLIFISSLRIEGLISKPILSLAEVAKSISANKNYAKRAEKNTDDEIGHLVDSFNEMIGEIQKRDEQLEQRVRERTHDLELEIKERVKAESEIKFKTEYENIILELSNSFINLPHERIDYGIKNALKEISEFSGAERCSVFQFDGYKTSLRCTHSWPETESPKQNEIINYKSLPGILKNTADGEIVKVNNYHSKTNLLYEDILELERRGIKSFISVPLFYSGSILGFVSFESRNKEIDWPGFTAPLLKISGEMLVNALKRKEVFNELNQSRMMLRTVIDNIPQAIFWKDHKSVYLGCNNTFAGYAGLGSTKDVAGLTDYDLPWSESQRESYLESERRVIFTGYPEYRVVQGQNQHNRDEESVIEVNRIPLFDSEDNIFGILGTYEDITERKLMEDELIKNRKLESFGTFAQGTVSDFNSLLTGILENIKLAKTELKDGSLTLQRLNDIEHSSLTARELTFKLQTFSTGKEKVKKTVNVKELLRETTILSLRGGDSSYRFFIDENLWDVVADEGELSQAVNNIVLNSAESMRDKPAGTVTVSAGNEIIEKSSESAPSEGRYIRVSIKDEGCGVERSDFAKIFEPYYSTKSGGQGLGLAYARTVVENHGGHIYFESETNRGSTFYIYLPASFNDNVVI